MNIAVLLSGGIDSFACARFYQIQRASLVALHVSYGQPAEKLELSAAKSISAWLSIELQHINITGVAKKDAGQIQARNALLLSIALMEEPRSPSLIAIGTHVGSPYYDCSEAFLSVMQSMYVGYSGGSVRLAAPFQTWTKAEILAFSTQEKIPIGLAHSCESGIAGGCGECLSCTELEAHGVKIR